MGLAVLDGFIYAIGGTCAFESLKSVERYNIQQNEWHHVTDLNRSSTDPGVGVLNKKIYVIGGFNNHTTSTLVQVYNSETNAWTSVNGTDFKNSTFKMMKYSFYKFSLSFSTDCIAVYCT